MRKAKWILAAAAIMAMAVSGSVQAQTTWGVGGLWTGGEFVPNVVIPIKMASGLVLSPMVGFDNVSADTPSDELSAQSSYLWEGTQIRFGLIGEKQTKLDGITPVFGAHAMVGLTSPDAEGLDSWTDFEIGAFFGGSVPVAENFDLVGAASLNVTLFGEQTAGDVILQPSITNIGTDFFAMFRWWIGGM